MAVDYKLAVNVVVSAGRAMGIKYKAPTKALRVALWLCRTASYSTDLQPIQDLVQDLDQNLRCLDSDRTALPPSPHNDRPVALDADIEAEES